MLNSNDLNGWIFLNKKSGITSAQALNVFKHNLRKITGLKKLPKIGFGGTLDPLASGVLPIAIGEATKTVEYMINKPKIYLFTITFGIATPSYDLGSEIIAINNQVPSKQAIINILKQFIGNITQVPPIYSAVKVNGKRAYKYARSGQECTLTPRKVQIHDLKLLSYKSYLKSATLIAKVGKGVYIRTLAYDIAKSLNTFGVVTYLRRVSLGNFKEKSLHSAHLFYNYNVPLTSCLLNIEESLADIPVINFNIEQANAILNGKVNFLSSSFFNNFPDNIYQGRYKNKVFTLLQVTKGAANVIRNFNQQFGGNDVDKQRA